MKRKGTKKRTRSQDRELAELLKRANAEHTAAQKALHGGITTGIKKSVPHMMNSGDYLLKVKKRAGHGQYLLRLAKDTKIPGVRLSAIAGWPNIAPKLKPNPPQWRI